jgi:beta-lactam-binding protein with PASTA domain
MPQIESGALVAGRYRLQSRLDSGGRAQVWTAVDDELKRDVAVKILLTPPGGDPSFVESFRAEAQLEAKLKHEGIVEVFDWGHDEDVNFVVMELLAGDTAARHVANGPLTPERVIEIGRQAAAALVYAHGEGVAHGSVGPGHVIVGPNARTTLIDFGLQCRGQCEYDAIADADTYALGALLYELLTGASPAGPRPLNLPDAEPWPAHPHKLNSNVPHELDKIVMKAISSVPAERYEHAADLKAALDELVRPKSHAGLWIALAVLAVLLAAGGTWLFASRQSIVVPDVTGKPSAEAQATLSSAGLKMVVTGQSPSTSIAVGSVVSEEPTAGSKVRRGTTVGVSLSTGKPTVAAPTVTGLDLQTATVNIANAGLIVGTVTTQSSAAFPVNTVISQAPAAGVEMSANSPINLVVSAGQVKVTVPDVRGLTESEATEKIESLGLVPDIGRAFSNEPSGLVLNQTPSAGTAVNAGATVAITVSKGQAPVQVPNVEGAQTADAKTSLQNLGLVPVTVETSGTPAQVGIVISQDPSAGTKVSPGSQVTITVGK